MGDVIQKYNIPRDNVRVILMTDDFIAQANKIVDTDGQRLIHGAQRKSLSRTGQGYGVELPTARVSILNPEPIIMPEGHQVNMSVTLAIDLIFNVAPTDEDDIEVDIQKEAHSLATYCWNWFVPYDEHAMTPQYPDVWRWDDKVRGKQNFSRNLTRIRPDEDNKLSGSVYVVPLFLPIIVFNPLIPWPIQ